MEKEVKLNGMTRTLFGEKEIKVFEKTAKEIEKAEKYLVNFYVGFRGDYITYTFGIDKRNVTENFELKFIFKDGLNLAELNTTWSNQYITDEFIELAILLNEIRNNFNK